MKQLKKFFYLTFILIQLKLFDFKVIFIVPKDSQQEHQLNREVELIFQETKITTGWLVEANVKNSFYLYLRSESYLNSSSIPHVYYIYFTIDSKSCSDYMSYTHIPIIINKSVMKKRHLFRIEVDITLKHEFNQVYYICLSQFNEG